MTLQRHLAALADGPHTQAAATAVVVGRRTDRHRDRVRATGAADGATPRRAARVVLVDHNPHVGSDMGTSRDP